jgi:hypothetical protein
MELMAHRGVGGGLDQSCGMSEGRSERLGDPLLGGDLSQVNDTLAVAPLVVVPGNNL